MGKMTKGPEKLKKSGPEKVRIELKSPDFHHYSSLDPVVRNAKFCIGPTADDNLYL